MSPMSISGVSKTHPLHIHDEVRTHATTRDNRYTSRYTSRRFHIYVSVQVNSRPKVVCDGLSHNHWLAFSAASGSSFKAPLSDRPRKPSSNRSIVVYLATKPPLVLYVLANLVPSFHYQSAYFSSFLSKVPSNTRSLTQRSKQCTHANNSTPWGYSSHLAKRFSELIFGLR